MTRKLVATQTLSSTQATIVFNSIPQDATDLEIFVSGRINNFTYDTLSLRFNGTTTAYKNLYAKGDGNGTVNAVTDADTGSLQISTALVGANSTANTFGNIKLYVTNYTAASAKAISYEGISEAATTVAYQTYGAGYWNNTAAINSITFYSYTSNSFVAGTTISLYTITKGSGGATVA